MSTHERDLNASGGSSPPEDSENSSASGDNDKGLRGEHVKLLSREVLGKLL
jgi:hypothetical protein